MQVEDRFRKTNHSSPEAQSKQTGRVSEPPAPSRSESFSNGNSESVHPALQRTAEPQVAIAWVVETLGPTPAQNSQFGLSAHLGRQRDSQSDF